MNFARRSVQLLNVCTRQLSTSSRIAAKDTVNLEKMKLAQEHFQIKDGQLVFLKGGLLDKFLYQATMGLCLIGLGLTGKLIYELSFPKK